MMDFQLTAEQQAIVTAARDTEDNLLVSALAGAAKTTTLVELAKVIERQTLCLAFNKKIALEMQTKLPPHCTAMTLNSMGHRAWGRALGKRLKVEEKKSYLIMRGLVEKLDGDDRDWGFENLSDLMRNLDSGKIAGWVPDSYRGTAKARPLMTDDEFFAWLDFEPDRLEQDLLIAAMLESIHQSYQGTIDFNDQIYMSTLFPAAFDLYPVVMVDEAQDLSALNHATLRKLHPKRLIAVGDACQSIYGFRGAHEDSMNLLRETFSMREMTLSISFRCPSSVVTEARWRAPHMQWPDWAKPGEVAHWTKWTADQLPSDAVILCRNNAPLFNMAIRLIKSGRYPELVGNDIGRSLIKIMKKFGPESMSQKEVLLSINEWAAAKKRKARNPDRVEDQADCMRIFAEQGDTLGQALLYAETIFNQSGPVKLMTGHKSKGLEFDNVYILDQHLINMKYGQDRNLKYVMQTRSKNTLTYIASDDFVETL